MKTKILILLFISGILSSCCSNSPMFVASDFTPENTFTKGVEGPAVDKSGIIYAVNYDRQGTIGSIKPDGTCRFFVELPDGSTGNGIRFDRKGDMLIADYTAHNILKVDMQTQEITVLAHNSNMNQPNDIAITDNDILFASDPDWQNNTGKLWRIMPDGTTTLLEDSMGTTNGIEVSPNNKRLYVNESIQRKIWVYDLSEEGNISNKRIFSEFEDYGLDGMRCDIDGSLYVTRHGKGTVLKINQMGEPVIEINLKGKNPTNIAFGGTNGKTCYVTVSDRGCIETFLADRPGRAAFKK